jgi:hypothetical protein
MKEKIFVSIASYRDPELLPTIFNCIENAMFPETLIFGIAWQHCDDDDWDNLNIYKNDSRFRILDIDYKESKGVCWARNLIQAKYDNESYYMQLDSHHRFIKNWDTELTDMIHYLQCKGNYKPILSVYLPDYFPNNDPSGRTNEAWVLNIDRFLPEGAVFLKPEGLDNWKNLKEPVPARFISGHFVFTIGDFVKEVPYDPNFYFHGEETSLAARAFTHGYDLFTPHKIYAWHEYTREGKKKHWDDNSFSDLDKYSYSRFRDLFGMNEEGCSPCAEKSFGKYWLGKERTLEQYERYTGIKFKTRQIHKEALENKPPPLQSDYDNGLCNKIKICIDVYKGSLPETDYVSFAVATLDELGHDIFRQDAGKEEIDNVLNTSKTDQFIHIWREYEDSKLPYSWRVWPYSKSKGWCDRIDHIISYE